MSGAATRTASEIFSVRGRVALVTGASSGLGAHFCRLLASHGASVVACARRTDRLVDLAASRENGPILPLPLDVTQAAAIPAAFEAAERAFGPVDILVNNAGAIRKGSVETETLDGWRAMIELNLSAAFAMSHEMSKRLIVAGRGGSIVNIASTAALLAPKGAVAYAAAKSGLIGLTRAAALDLAPFGIRCNAIIPGNTVSGIFPAAFFDSPTGRKIVSGIPLGRHGEPDDLDGALLLLASDASRHMTGSAIVVDGGKTTSQAAS